MKRFIVSITYVSFILFLLVGCETESEPEETTKELKYEGSTIEIGDQSNLWKLTPKYDYQTEGRNGERKTYEVIGKKDGFGITTSFPITAKKGQKFFWFYWGEEDIKNQPVKVLGYKKGSNEIVTLFRGEFYEEAQINEDEVNMPSNLTFQSPGIWNVLVYMDGEVKGNLVVKVVPRR
ncbi:hypothetical protein [Pontibacillus marinus]|uniref:DUF4871 domain-containing protein n=1 Tax=Pontibacillus marinus BH030004 = DSM 16465 TaxID=1385511 RepID=A0A0A5GFB6_9BACI|nr:hypothetical protein [Pontibacillus marinus]KGX91906.1 hypothetical protein N783_00940 [Pontibacillus marinus BH030004 = DSM 16465]